MRWCFFFSFLWICSIAFADYFPGDSEKDRVEYILYYEIMLEGDPPIAVGVVGAEGYKPRPPKKIIKSKITSPPIHLISNDGSQSLELNNNGFFFNKKLVCTWSKGEYNSTTNPAGYGVMLKACPSWVPFITYDAGHELGEIKKVLSIPYTRKVGDKISVQTNIGVEFSGFLPKLKKPWLEKLARSKTERRKIDYIFDKDKTFSIFASSLNKCTKKTWSKNCLPDFFDKKNALEPRYALWDPSSKISPIFCPPNNGYKELNLQDYLKCLDDNPDLKKEITTCSSRKASDYKDIWITGEASRVSPREWEKLVNDKNQEIQLTIRGEFYKCNFSRGQNQWTLLTLEPDMYRLSSLQADGVLAVIGPALWPFKKRAALDIGISLYKFYIMRDRQEVLRELSARLPGYLNQRRKQNPSTINQGSEE
ncbi:MAG: hypothetical protein A2X86_02240 [Bdellovibrionales bacterium GWA2_49_15]|nr:MAG: hypothetical protein A2X86_02240 [Bdellovibrionales bacterium GWA2_49_15]